MQAEAAQQIGGDRLFSATALPRLLCGFGMDRFPLPHQGVVDSAEGGHIIAGERALLMPRRRADPVGAQQQLHYRLGPLLAGDFFHVDQFTQQVGIAQGMDGIVEFPVRRPAIMHQHAKAVRQDAMCSQCSLPAARRPDSAALRTGAARNWSAIWSAVACRAALASATHASNVAGEIARPYTSKISSAARAYGSIWP